MTSPASVKELVKRFEDNQQSYRSGKYNETQLRHEFLDPFFEALGWDILNKQGYVETFKDVIHEDSLEIEGENKAPEYAFRMGECAGFFVSKVGETQQSALFIMGGDEMMEYKLSALKSRAPIPVSLPQVEETKTPQLMDAAGEFLLQD